MQRYLIGMGNYARQDDGIGLRVIEHIIDNDLDDGFVAMEAGNDGLSVMTCFSEETEFILIVDCAMIDREPGDHMIFDVRDVESKKVVGSISTHEGDVLKIVSMAETLDYYVPPVKVLAIQPESMEMEMGLSPLLESRLQDYVDAAIAEMKKN